MWSGINAGTGYSRTGGQDRKGNYNTRGRGNPVHHIALPGFWWAGNVKVTLIKGFIFDFDGLILDTELPIYAAWQDIYREYQQHLPLETWVQCVGSSYQAFDPAEHLQSLIRRNLDRQALHQRAEEISNQIIDQTGPLPGVKEFLQSCRQFNFRLAIASSSDSRWVNRHLERLELKQYFDCILTCETVKHVKPAPDLFIMALHHLSLQPEETVIFEDSQNGILAGVRAGIRVVAVPNDITRHLDLSRASWIIPSFHGISPLDVLAHFDGHS